MAEHAGLVIIVQQKKVWQSAANDQASSFTRLPGGILVRSLIFSHNLRLSYLMSLGFFHFIVSLEIFAIQVTGMFQLYILS